MNSTLEKYFKYASLSFASYAEGLSSQINDVLFLESLKDGGMSTSQAELFIEKYQVLDQFTGGIFSSGFSEKGTDLFLIQR